MEGGQLEATRFQEAFFGTFSFWQPLHKRSQKADPHPIFPRPHSPALTQRSCKPSPLPGTEDG